MSLFKKLRPTLPDHADAGAGDSAAREHEAARLIDEGNAFEDAGRPDLALQRYEAATRLAPELPRAHLNRGNMLLATGNAEAALGAYAVALEQQPDYASAHFNVGVAHLRVGRHDAALVAFRRAITLKPDWFEAELARGNVLQDLGRLDEAAASFRRALVIRPNSAEVHNSLGVTLQHAEKSDDAIASLRQSVAIDPEYAEAYNNLGNALMSLGQVDAAAANYRRAVAIRNDFAEAHNNLGVALKDIAPDDAVASFRRALAIKPDYTDAHNNLGAVLKDIAPGDALASFRRALAINPGYVEAHNNLGIALRDIGKFDDAVATFARALTIKPDFADAHCNLGAALHASGHLDEAAASYRRALAINPDLLTAHNNLGITLTEIGQLDAAVVSLERALSIDPEDPGVHSNLLFIQNYLSDQPASHLLEAARRYGHLVAARARPYTDWPNLPDPARCLRVGIVSGDLLGHPVGYFAQSVFASLASEFSDQLEIIAYASHAATDRVTERIKASCLGWHSIVGLSDERLAQRIRQDGIDILIDLSGHNARNRLPMFAWRPAPVQATWIGYFATTGVDAIDYFIADPWTLPQSEEVNFTEKIWRLPETRFCFTAPDLDMDVSPLPALHTGHVTFGCFNHLAKVNDRVVALWANVLAEVPNSRLFLKSVQIGDASVRQALVDRFDANGIRADRLILEGRSPLAEYFAAYQRVDIGLDPFPYTGGATTAQSLWMGVPVLTLAGNSLLSRQGLGLLMNVGLPEWVAVDASDYVARAASHARDLRRLGSLRSTLRDRALVSPIFDAPRFAYHLVGALRGMWRDWCRRQ